MEATYTKLKDGSWGIRYAGIPRQGSTVTVRRKDGTTKQEKIAKVLWTGKDRDGETISLCSIAREASQDEDVLCVECGRPARTKCSGCGAPLHKDCADGGFGSGILCQGCCY
jgi:hypothetical protein